jgi:hypothetical protein
MQVLAGHDVGRGHGPVLGNFDIFLLEDDAALGVGDLRVAQLPLDFVIGRNAGLGEEAAESQAGGLLGGYGDGRGRADGGLGGGGGGSFFGDFRHRSFFLSFYKFCNAFAIAPFGRGLHGLRFSIQDLRPELTPGGWRQRALPRSNPGSHHRNQALTGGPSQPNIFSIPARLSKRSSQRYPSEDRPKTL